MRWLHGGHFFLGQGDTWGGRTMAVDGDAVVVTVNRRLGPLGFLTHSAVGGSGNFGLEGQPAAQRWVRANVAAFGGDPRNVTLAGHSAGATSVCAHLAAPRSAGPFHRAILQSNSCTRPLPTRDEAATGVDTLVAAVGCDSNPAGVGACLRSRSAQELLEAAGYPGQSAWEAGPVAGGSVLPVDPAAAVAAGRFHRVPVLVGATRHENRALKASDLDTRNRPQRAHAPAARGCSAVGLGSQPARDVWDGLQVGGYVVAELNHRDR